MFQKSLSNLLFTTLYLLFIGGLFFASFVYSIFPKDMNRVPVRLFQACALVLTLITIFAPIIVFTHTVVIFQVLTLVAGLYVMVVLAIATFKRRESRAI